jgi:hypothetical protein
VYRKGYALFTSSPILDHITLAVNVLIAIQYDEFDMFFSDLFKRNLETDMEKKKH